MAAQNKPPVKPAYVRRECDHWLQQWRPDDPAKELARRQSRSLTRLGDRPCAWVEAVLAVGSVELRRVKAVRVSRRSEKRLKTGGHDRPPVLPLKQFHGAGMPGLTGSRIETALGGDRWYARHVPYKRGISATPQAGDQHRPGSMKLFVIQLVLLLNSHCAWPLGSRSLLWRPVRRPFFDSWEIDMTTTNESSKPAWTNGPWTAYGDPCADNDEAMAVCKKIIDTHVKPSNGYFYVVCVPDNRCAALVGHGPDAAANAALIAAAPDLARTVEIQHRIIDMLLARVIELDEAFMVTKSKVWPMLLEADALGVLKKARG